MKAAGRVSAAEREAARKADLLASGVLRQALPVVTRRVGVILLGILSEYRRTGHVASSIIHDKLPRALGVMMMPTMALARLRGIQWAAKAAPAPIKFAQDAVTKFDNSVAFTAERLKVSPRALQQMAETMKANGLTIVDKASASIEDELQTVVSDIVQRGLHVRDGVQELSDAFTRLGISPSNAYTLENIYRTQVQLAFAAGEGDILASPDVQDILWGYKYVTVGDTRVRPAHRLLDGTTLPKDDPLWATAKPPNGYSCRCKAIAIFRPRKLVPAPDPQMVGGSLVTPGPDKGFAYDPATLFKRVRLAG